MESVVQSLIGIAQDQLSKTCTPPEKAAYLQEAINLLNGVLNNLRDPQIDRSIIYRNFSMAMIRLGAGGALDNEEDD